MVSFVVLGLSSVHLPYYDVRVPHLSVLATREYVERNVSVHCGRWGSLHWGKSHIGRHAFD